jgi:hypothetical protein
MIDVINTYCIISICINACALIYSSRSECTCVREKLFGLSLQSGMKSRNNDHFGELVTKGCKITPAIFVIYVCQTLILFAWNNSRTAEWILMKFGMGQYD